MQTRGRVGASLNSWRTVQSFRRQVYITCRLLHSPAIVANACPWGCAMRLWSSLHYPRRLKGQAKDNLRFLIRQDGVGLHRVDHSAPGRGKAETETPSSGWGFVDTLHDDHWVYQGFQSNTENREPSWCQTFVVTWSITSCHNDNLWCRQWWQSWHRDNCNSWYRGSLNISWICVRINHELVFSVYKWLFYIAINPTSVNTGLTAAKNNPILNRSCIWWYGLRGTSVGTIGSILAPLCHIV